MNQDVLPPCLRWSADLQEKTTQARDLPGTLFSQLSDALVASNPPAPQLILAAWEERLKLPAEENDSVADETLSSWINAYEFAWRRRQGTGPAADSDQEPYVRVCAKLLAGGVKRISVPIATVDGHSQGRIQTLWIDFVEDQVGLILLHPQFAWTRADFHTGFHCSIEAAWRLAGNGIPARFSAFWHVSEADGTPITSEQQSGTSASAAAFRAFWYGRRELPLDENVFVLASCAIADDGIHDVGDLGAKIIAIRQYHDSLKPEVPAIIVISSTSTNRTPQDEAIIACAFTWAEVKPVATTGELAAVRSRTPPAQLVGSHYVLLRLPILASFLILAGITVGVMHVLRDAFEGLGYQVAYSDKFGSWLLIGAVLVATWILKRGPVLSWWLISRAFHASAVLISLVFGFTWWSCVRPTYWGDIYYLLFIAPLLLYLALTLLPVIFINGKRIEKLCVTCFALVQIVLVVIDVTGGRMSQHKWLEEHGIPLKE